MSFARFGFAAFAHQRLELRHGFVLGNVEMMTVVLLLSISSALSHSSVSIQFHHNGSCGIFIVSTEGMRSTVAAQCGCRDEQN
eukprot:scaffold93044_cov72-Cyclotella_meneghiniana.AAC.2